MFENFELTILAAEPPADGANVQVRFGQDIETSTFSLAAVAGVLTQLNDALLQSKPAQEVVQAAGGALFEALFTGRLLRAYMKGVALASQRGSQLRLRIVSETPSIVAVPWEYLYDRAEGRWLALDPDLSLVRSLPLAGGDSGPVEGNLRVLVMLADPTNLPRLDSAREWAQLQEATAAAAIDLIRVEPTYGDLQVALRQQPHIFHFVGHGDFPTAGQNDESGASRAYRPAAERQTEQGLAQGALFFCTADGRADQIPADRLAPLLTSCATLRLAVLNSCRGAQSGARSAFAGVAQRLIQGGAPTVLAMQAPIYDDHALRFSQEFYRALADGYSVEGAVHQGRLRINEVAYSWGIPALYYQQNEPFAIRPLSAPEKAARLWQRLAQPAEHKAAEQRRLLDQILQLDPGHAEARKALDQLARTEQATNLYAAARAYYENGQWREAHRTLELVERQVANFKDARSLLAEVLGKLGGAAQTITPQFAAQPIEYQAILNALKEGRLVPFLGGDASRFGRPAADSWARGHYLPGADEIADHLATFMTAEWAGLGSLLQVSQYTTMLESDTALYDRLNDLFAADYPPTILHRLLAELPGRLRAKGYPARADRRFVLFSTAFDDLLEVAFAEAGQPFHLFAYRPRRDERGGEQKGHFVHLPPGGDAVPVLTPNEYTGHDDAERLPVIVKLCGRRVSAEPDSVLVTEDQYLDYLPSQEIGALLPMTLLTQIRQCSFAFFGYTLQPWHFRLLWKRMSYQGQPLHKGGWAVLANPSAIEGKFWSDQRITPLTAAPEGVVAYINQWLDTLEPRL